MTRYALIALLTALVAAVAYAGWVTVDRNGLRSELATETARREQAETGSAELSRFVREQRHRDRMLRTILDDLHNGDFENADTPLDPDLQRILECLRTGNVDCGLSSGLPD